MKEELTFHFLKSQDFKTHYVSGIFGGITPAGQINMMHFIERVPLPTTINYGLLKDGTLKEIGRETKDGLVRETQGGLIMDLAQAKSIVEWLNNKISVLEAQTSQL